MSPKIALLFRYRNLLVDNTLERHREIIEAEGSCWWGWWHRPSEDLHLDLWGELEREIRAQGHAWVGLFDSEPDKPGTVHLAKVTEVKLPKPSADQPGRVDVPKLADAEIHLVPDYYRETPFSSAWLRLEVIGAEPIDFFREYSYRLPPKVARIDEAQLARFRDKLILDADELRAMDTTMWAVRPAKKKADNSERILTTSARVTTAHSNEPIALPGKCILHLSDLHFSSSHRDEHAWAYISETSKLAGRRQPLVEKIVSALGPDHDIGLVLISGDLTYLASKAEIYEAFRFVHRLLGALKLGVEHLVVIPGNHDIAWSKPKDTRWNRDSPVEASSAEAEAAYREFHQRVFRYSANEHLSMARRFVTPGGRVLEVAALNTSSLESGNNWLAGMGRVASGAFEAVARSLGWQNDSTAALRLLVLHHHLMPVEDVMPTAEFERGFGMASDARKILRAAAGWGVQLALHGHRHRPFIGRERVYSDLSSKDGGRELGEISVVGSGSAGSSSVELGNYFNVLEIEADELRLKSYLSTLKDDDRKDFSLDGEWSASCEQQGARLVIGPWQRPASP